MRRLAKAPRHVQAEHGKSLTADERDDLRPRLQAEIDRLKKLKKKQKMKKFTLNQQNNFKKILSAMRDGAKTIQVMSTKIRLTEQWVWTNLKIMVECGLVRVARKRAGNTSSEFALCALAAEFDAAYGVERLGRKSIMTPECRAWMGMAA
ncbi:hypothetical protein [Herminiimonas sp. CN]|uniref:hypothetical protein n=1 Tax=Herminiimonas sp. CN TaxID=1349818 RepID=UPI00047420F1|nr:hypothetical protein [Herminiimonas sp. CN]